MRGLCSVLLASLPFLGLAFGELQGIQRSEGNQEFHH